MLKRASRVAGVSLVLGMSSFAVAPTARRAEAALARVPLSFVENKGQVAGPAAYYAQGRDRSVAFAEGGLTFALRDAEKSCTVKLDFVGASAGVKPSGVNATGAVFNYLKGSAAERKTGIRSFADVTYADLWPGIDLTFSGTQDKLKWTFVVRPGADPSKIRFAYRGASDVQIDDGRLLVKTPAGDIDDDVPVAWQGDGAARTDVSTAFVLDDANTCGFRLGAYDATRPLVIDPDTTIYAGYLGGAGIDTPTGMVMDDAGAVYVTGKTTSSDFPVGAGLDTTFNAGVFDAFVVKIKPDGSALEWGTFLGGAGIDLGGAVAVDSSHNVYVTGNTYSYADFPIVGGPGTGFVGSSDGFITKIDSSGASIVYSFLLGGGDNGTAGSGIAVDETGAAYVTGKTDGVGFPATTSTYGGGSLDAFVAKVKPDGSGLVYARYLGGAGIDYANGIGVDAGHNAYVVGNTYSGDFPAVVGPGKTFQVTTGDGFITKVDTAGAIVYSGSVGGSGFDYCNAVAVTPGGAAYVCGSTTSTDLAVKVGPRLTYNSGVSQDAYCGKVKLDGSGFDFLGYIGGAGANDVKCVTLTAPAISKSGEKLALFGPNDYLVEETNASGGKDMYLVLVEDHGLAFSVAKILLVSDVRGKADGRGVAVSDLVVAALLELIDGSLATKGPLGATAPAGVNAYVQTVAPETPTVGEFAAVASKFTAKKRSSTRWVFSANLTLDSFIDGQDALQLDPGSPTDVILVGEGGSGITVSIDGIPKVKPYNASGDGAKLRISASPIGSSRATVVFSYDGDPGAFVAEGPVSIHIANAAFQADGTFIVTKGKYTAGKIPGTLTSPAFALSSFSATPKAGDANDTLAASFVFNSDGTVPTTAPSLHFACSVGGQTAAEFTVPSTAEWKLKKGQWTFKAKAPGITSATIDYARGTISIAGSKLDLTPFEGAGPTFDTTFTVNLGDAAGDRTVEATTARLGKSISY